MAETDTVHPMTGRWARAVTLLVGVAATTGACSGSDGATPATPLESAEPITAPPSTDAAVSTTATTETSASTTTATSTIATTTTTEPAPTTTTLDDLRAEIEADLNEGEQAFLQGASTPDDPDSIAALTSFNSGRSLEIAEELYAALVANGQSARASVEVPSTIRVEEILSTEAAATRVIYCRIDGAVVFNSDGSVANDEPVRYVVDAEVVLDAATWKLNDGETLARVPGSTSCDS